MNKNVCDNGIDPNHIYDEFPPHEFSYICRYGTHVRHLLRTMEGSEEEKEWFAKFKAIEELTKSNPCESCLIDPSAG